MACVSRLTRRKRTGHAAIDSTGFDRDHPSRYYAQRAHYRVRSLKVTALVDVETLYVTDVHCTTTKKHDAKIGPQVARRNAGDLLSLAADRAYDGKPFRDELRIDRIRPLIKHRIYSSLDRAHNARMSSRWYNRRWMVEEDTLHRVTRPKNLELLRTLARERPESIRETARLVDRDVRQVHRNLKELEDLGLVEFEENGRSKRPGVWYDEIAVELPLTGDDETDAGEAVEA